MKKIRTWFCLLTVIVNASTVLGDTTPLAFHKQTCQMVHGVVRVNHYAKPKISAEFYQHVFETFINNLDVRRVYFTAEDVAELESYWLQDKTLGLTCSLGGPFFVYERFLTRFIERHQFAITMLDNTFSFSEDDYLPNRNQSHRWLPSGAERDLYWQKYVKNDILTLMLANVTADKARELLKSRYEAIIQRLQRSTSDDYLAGYLQAFTESIDPHTQYYPPVDLTKFNTEMALQRVGIGMVVESDGVYSRVSSLVTGGPAESSGQVRVGDRILAIAEGDSPSTDVVGWRLDDIVERMRGTAGSNVTLTLLDGYITAGAPRKVSIKRQKVNLQDQRVSYQLYPGKLSSAGMLAHIRLPRFYLDMAARGRGDANYISASKDLSRILSELNEKKIEGVLLDLSNNAGGTIEEAAQVVDHFIDKGPVFLARDKDGAISLNEATIDGRVWNGPLVVMVNQHSAGTSEIIAAALQDLNRAVIVGEQTFGLGTVSRIVDLNRLRDDDRINFGQLKISESKYYRISGQSIHIDGVQPDITYVTPDELPPHGERVLVSTIPRDIIPGTKVVGDSVVTGDLLAALIELSTKRMQRDKAFVVWKKTLLIGKQPEQTQGLSLNKSKREQQLSLELYRQQSNTDFNIARLNEALNVLSDEINLKKVFNESKNEPM